MDKKDIIESHTIPFDVRDKVWMMCGNKPREGTIYGILIKPEYGAIGEIKKTYLVWASTSLCGVVEDRCHRRSEDDLARSKGELLEKIFSQ